MGDDILVECVANMPIDQPKNEETEKDHDHVEEDNSAQGVAAG